MFNLPVFILRLCGAEYISVCSFAVEILTIYLFILVELLWYAVGCE